MPGIGSSNVGVAPFGPGAPAVAAAPTAPPTGAKFLNYQTGDYERDATGAYKRMPVTRQRVQLAVGTRRGTASAIPSLGTQFPAKITEHFERRVRQEVQRALQRLIDEGEIMLDSITIDDEGLVGRRTIVIAYTTPDGISDTARV